MVCLSIISLALAVGTSARPLHYIRRAALDTGSCGSPEIEFADGLDGRDEPSFQAVNQQDFSHGSALNIGVISGFICQQLNDKCKASAATLAACAQGQTAAGQATGGAAADAFNAALGIQSNFANGAVASSSAAAATVAAPVASTTTTASTNDDPASAVDSISFGSCSNPAIEFGPGFDGRKATEFSFEPQDKNSIDHGSALNIDIITQATCDQLKDKCKASAAALAACAQGQKDADAQAKGTGAQADAFNAALGIQTNFAQTPAALGGGVATAADIAAANTPSIGSCSNPTISFGIFDGRTEDSFEPANLVDFNHSSALNINIITQFICDTFVNTCNANQAAVDSCAAAKLAVNGLTGQAAANAFNAAVLTPVSS